MRIYAEFQIILSNTDTNQFKDLNGESKIIPFELFTFRNITIDLLAIVCFEQSQNYKGVTVIELQGGRTTHLVISYDVFRDLLINLKNKSNRNIILN